MPRVTQFVQIFVVIIFTCAIHSSFGQRMKVDSLLEALEGEISDSLRMRYYADIAFDFTYIDLDSATFYAEKSLETAMRSADEKGRMKAYYTNGVVEFSKGNYDNSLSYFDKSLVISNRLESKQSALIYNMLGQISQNKTKYDEAIEYFYKSAAIAEEIGNFGNWVAAMVNIANVHYDLKDIKNTKRIYEDIISKEDQLVPEHLSMILANYTYLIDDDDEKVKYLNKSIAVSKEHGIIDTEANGYKLLADIYLQNPDSTDKALQVYRKAISLYEGVGLKTEISKSLTNYGSALLQLGKNDEALSALLRADEIAQSIDYNTQIVTVNEILANLYEQNGNYKKALESVRIYNSIRDSVYESSVSEKVLEANAKYESEKKEAEIARQQLKIAEQESNRKLITLGGLGGLSVLSLLFYGFINVIKGRQKKVNLH